MLPDYCFWNRSVGSMPPGGIDPVVKSKFIISKADKVSTMGSCFAQHVSRKIQELNFNYFVPELGVFENISIEAKAAGYGVFSARYGNVYTVKQAVQLFDRAFGSYEPQVSVWRYNNRFVDPFRPTIEADGFETEIDLLEDRKKHLNAVKQVFLESNYIVLTLGLTEGWRSKVDGAILPLSPGVHGGEYSEEKYESVNFTTSEVRNDLDSLIAKAVSVNPKVKFILTVSPVPLIATHQDKHVLASTCYSKSVLRVVAEEVDIKYENVMYFPSYEIITSNYSANSYYENDLRGVREAGVEHVMRIFSRHMIIGDDNDNKTNNHHILNEESRGVICDEEKIELSLRGN
jgi:hypothetical protein